MALTADEVNVEERKAAGRAAALAKGATQPKTLREGLAEEYPYTYWYWVGYNEHVESLSN